MTIAQRRAESRDIFILSFVSISWPIVRVATRRRSHDKSLHTRSEKFLVWKAPSLFWFVKLCENYKDNFVNVLLVTRRNKN